MKVIPGVLLLALAGCATKPGPLEPLQLVGTEPFWGGMLTRESLRLTRVDHPEIVVRHPGFPCAGVSRPCFFGNVGGSRYVNAPSPDGRYFSLVADREPCSDGMSDRTYPYKVTIYWRNAPAEATRERLEGCGGPPSMFWPGGR